MKKYQIAIVSALSVFVLLMAFLLLRPSFKLHSNRFVPRITGRSGLNTYSLEGPLQEYDAQGNYIGHPERTKILLVVAHRKKPKTVYLSDFELTYREIETNSWKILPCTAYCCVPNPEWEGVWFMDNNGIKLRGRDDKYVVAAFFVPTNLQDVTFLFRNKTVGQFHVKYDN